MNSFVYILKTIKIKNKKIIISDIRGIFDKIDAAKQLLIKNPGWFEENYYNFALIEKYELNKITDFL